MKIRLVEKAGGPEDTRETLIKQDDFLIGRGADCDLRLNETTISRHHCIIRPGMDDATLIDLGSSNGTYLNGQRVRSTAPLHTGDELLLGTRRFAIVLGDDEMVDFGGVSEEGPMATTFKLRDLPRR